MRGLAVVRSARNQNNRADKVRRKQWSVLAVVVTDDETFPALPGARLVFHEPIRIRFHGMTLVTAVFTPLEVRGELSVAYEALCQVLVTAIGDSRRGRARRKASSRQ